MAEQKIKLKLKKKESTPTTLKPKLKLKSKVSKEDIKEESSSQPVANSLEEVMDKTKLFTLIYSGVEQERYFDIMYTEGKIKNFLMSFHYISNSKISLEKRLENKPDLKLFIDSGAHTYMNDPKYLDYDVDYWEKHLQKYLRWAEKNKKYIFAIASFDFEAVVGAEKVHEWNRKYLEPFMLRTGIPVCFVWHDDSYLTWEQYCQRYPYVGFSSINTNGDALELNDYKEFLRTAEKYDSLVHGFGMTKTSLLTSLPFYTVDSTSWQAGLRFGEMNYWNGQKMSRLSKDKWQSDRYLSEIAEKCHLNKEDLYNEEYYAVIVANVHPFIEAEEFIQTRLKKDMYWLKAKTTKIDINNLPSDYFPSVDFLSSQNSSLEEFQEYARKMNINPELNDDTITMVFDMTILYNWYDPTYDKLHYLYEENDFALINQLHDTFINKPALNVETKIQELIDFYTSCLSGNNDTLLIYGTNFDRRVKEREYYIDDEDEETELQDLSYSETMSKLLMFIPEENRQEGAPEIDSLDEEIFGKAGIVPTFDERGKFVKGQVSVQKPKKVYSDKYPKYACDTCYNAQRCPEYKAGYVCAFSKSFKKFDTRSMSDIIQATQGIVNHNLTRMQRAMVGEIIGGAPDPMVSQLMDQNIRYLNMLQTMYQRGSQEVLRQTRVTRADGTLEESTQISNPQQGGILEKLFSTITPNKSGEEPIDADFKEKEEPMQKNARYENLDEDLD